MRIFYFLLTIIFFYGFQCAASGAAADGHFAFSGFHGADLNLDGTAMVTPEGLLELTNGTVQLKGHAFFPAPFRLRRLPGGTVQSFSASFVFGILTTYPNLSGHGIAFVIAPSKNFSTALAAQYMGLVNIDNNGNGSNHIFTSELDTMQNIEFEDIDNNHVGVNINGLYSVQSHTAGYYGNIENDSFQRMSLISGDVMRAWVDYDGELARIDITVAPVQMSKPARPLVSATYNLSDVLTEQAYIGFSSATGPINSRHYILGWSFGINRPAPAIDIVKLAKLPRLGSKPRSKVQEILTPVAVATFLLALGIVVVLLVRKRLRYAELREDWEVEFGPHRFSYKDLFHATDGFNVRQAPSRRRWVRQGV